MKGTNNPKSNKDSDESKDIVQICIIPTDEVNEDGAVKLQLAYTYRFE